MVAWGIPIVLKVGDFTPYRGSDIVRKLDKNGKGPFGRPINFPGAIRGQKYQDFKACIFGSSRR